MNWILNRDGLPNWLNEHGLTGIGAEIGVELGHYSALLLHRWRGKFLYFVDQWKADANWMANDTDERHEANYQSFLARVQTAIGDHGPGCADHEVLRESSLEAAKRIACLPEIRFDFVYIDANHKYSFVRDDIAAWAPLMRSGGLLCGHDYLQGVCWPGPKDDFDYGVKQAVDEFAAAHGNLEVMTTVEDPWPSWGIVMP